MTAPFYSLLDAVWALEVDPTVKLVALRLARHYPVIRPKVAAIAAACRLGERTVQRALRELVDAGILTVSERPGQTSVYAFVGGHVTPLGAAGGATLAPRHGGGGDTGDGGRGDTGDTPGVPMATSHLMNHQMNNQTNDQGRSVCVLGADAPVETGAQPVMRYQFRPTWKPKRRHRDRGIELGLTDEEILARAEDCKLKPVKHGFFNEDDHFMRELTWARNEKETRRLRDQAHANRQDFESPGHRRRATS